jgi:hypothetical protein
VLAAALRCRLHTDIQLAIAGFPKTHQRTLNMLFFLNI